ncbi:MAG: homoserine dehydrogenase [Candidatus Latescibacterota bacterium]|jgi:homoserine dehydrogenase
MNRPVGIGLIGLGNVGSGLVRLLHDAPAAVRRRRMDFALRRIAVRDPARPRDVAVDPALLTGAAMEVVEDPAVDLVVELTGAPGAIEWVRAALASGKDVVTANKAMLAEHGDELFELALARGVDLMFEASVAGGIPIIRSLRAGLVANRVESLYGILNGTTNYILTQMSRGAGDYPEILRLAQEKGFAEPDPTMDVSGRDAAQKLSILCRIAFHSRVIGSQVFCEGIERIEALDLQYARELGYTVKLLAIAKLAGDRVQARVHPAMVPNDSLLANIHDEFNAIEVVGSAVGNQVFYGRGAGQMPTASAVMADLVDLVQRKRVGAGTAIGDMILGDGALELADIAESELRYYLRLRVSDCPGVLEKIAHVLAVERISIASVLQKQRDLQGGSVPLVIVTHEARERQMSRALAALTGLSEVKGEPQLIRMEDL